MSKNRHTHHITDEEADDIITSIKLNYHLFLQALNDNPKAFEFDQSNFGQEVIFVDNDIDYLFVDKDLKFTNDEMDEALENKKTLSKQFQHNSSNYIESSVVFNNPKLRWIYDANKSIVWNASIHRAIKTRQYHYHEKQYKMLKAFGVDFTTLRYQFDSGIKEALAKLNQDPNKNPFEYATVIRPLFSPKQADFWEERSLLKQVRRYIYEYNVLQNKLEREHKDADNDFDVKDFQSFPETYGFQNLPYIKIFDLTN